MIAITVAGIPAKVRVDSCVRVPAWRGSPDRCPSDMDWSGYTEMEYTICDQRGRPAPWLERKATAADRDRIEVAILEDQQ